MLKNGSKSPRIKLAFNKTARSLRISHKTNRKQPTQQNTKKHTFDTVNIISRQVIGLECFLVKKRIIKWFLSVLLCYYPDGTPKRTVGIFYEDINMVWSKDMDERDYGAHERGCGIKSIIRID